jgi:nicotinamidase/pyrazinamidase
MARYDATTALVVVDMQNDFAHPEGSLSVEGGADVVGAVNREIAAAREAGAPVVFSRDWHPPDTPHFEKDGGIWPVHCVRGTWGAEFVDGLDLGDLERGAEVVSKGTGGEDGYSVFSVRDPRSGATSDTVLEQLLRARGVERIVLVGLATDYCVKETVLDARRRGFGAEVVGDGVRPVDRDPGDGERALDEMIRAGATLS